MDDFIAEADVASKLKDVFQTPFLTVTIDDDGDICIDEGLGYPVWVKVDTERSLIKLFTYANFEDV